MPRNDGRWDVSVQRPTRAEWVKRLFVRYALVSPIMAISVGVPPIFASAYIARGACTFRSANPPPPVPWLMEAMPLGLKVGSVARRNQPNLWLQNEKF